MKTKEEFASEISRLVNLAADAKINDEDICDFLIRKGVCWAIGNNIPGNIPGESSEDWVLNHVYGYIALMRKI